jgi:hypothetical protein
MAFVNHYSFTHRFNAQDTALDEPGYQEIVHQCDHVNAVGLTRQFFQFALGCGYAPQSMAHAFDLLAEEYGKAYCGYNEGKRKEQC